jgi:feruloyl esterase
VEAVVVNRIWDGPRNVRGQRLWGGIPRGTSFSGQVPGGINNLIIDQFVRFWLTQDPTFEWPAQITMENFGEYFELASRKFGNGIAESDNPDLDTVRDSGAKIIHYHGTGDVLIMPFGAWKYSSDVMERYGVRKSQDFIRTFIYPESGHCGGGPAGTPLINTGDLFAALENWVENGVAPDHIVAQSSDQSRSRKICMYPNEAVYRGTGSTDDQRSFRCKVNREEPRDLKRESVTARLYHEAP